MSLSKIPIFTFLNRFSLYEIVEFVFLILSIVSIVVFPCISIFEPDAPSSQCNSMPTFSYVLDANFIIERFRDFTNAIEKSVNIVVSAGKTENIDLFIDIINGLAKRGINVKIFTNKHGVNFSSNVKVKYFQDDSLEMHINFAVADNKMFFFPSSFIDQNESKVVMSYYVESSGTCESAADDLNSLFDMLWYRPKNKPSYVQKYKWVADKGFSNKHRYFCFLLDPFDKFPTNRMNHTEALFNTFSDLVPRIIFTKSFFPEGTINSSVMSLFTNIATLIESPSFSNFDLTLAVDADDFEKNIENYRSLLATLKTDEDLMRCNTDLDFDGTIIISQSKKVLFPATISNVFSPNQLILGLYDQTVNMIENQKEIITFLSENKICKGTTLP